MWYPIRVFFLSLLIIGTAQASNGASPANATSTIVILTSFPESFYTPIKQAFERTHPDISLRVLNKKTPALIQHLNQRRSPFADMVWMSSSDAMATLKASGAIQQPLTFAWSQFGFFWHQEKLQSLGISAPNRWEDLLHPNFIDQIAISAPSRSGTNHLLIEIILQQYGWEKGWAYLNQLGGNLATVTARSFGVREGVIKQRFTVGPVVDFFYRSAVAKGYPVGFQPVPNTPLIPAQIAMTNRENQSTSSQVFVDFLLSNQGQSLLSLPNVNRITLEQGRAIASTMPTPVFDPFLSAIRYQTVNALFDEVVTNRLPELHSFWQKWALINTQALSVKDRKSLNAIYQQATQMPVHNEGASDEKFNNVLDANKKYTASFQSLTESWRQQLHRNLTDANAGLDALLYKDVE
ncbi:ABC transporter substrate-binding protein [Enterovibrio norvegicus]|uniref:ABC transporter substrate-binding protein n=1 Tax=Enterovibrio norvegicus TaxID=188144 RepID=UPI0013D836DB|nr:ABC transporter substrate-binding protein [Enterovibrio norvegicus]